MVLAPGEGTALVHEERLDDLNKMGRPLSLLDLTTGASKELTAFGEPALHRTIALSGDVAAIGGLDGIIRVGRVSGGEPHLLVGHEGAIEYLAVSPDQRWIASRGEDRTLRLWPMPDLDAPPLHTLPHDELISKLKSLTNIRVVRDRDSAEGWKVELDEFPGWKEIPEW
jgi:WD40 repeat protein